MSSSEYLQSVIENKGQECGNCGAWRILKQICGDERSPVEAVLMRIIEECDECGDEAFDIYEIADDCP